MQLKNMHPFLPLSTAVEYGHRAVVGLERHRHEPGIALATWMENEAHEASLHWIGSPFGDGSDADHSSRFGCDGKRKIMSLEFLYPLVTEAIRRAESLEDLGAP